VRRSDCARETELIDALRTGTWPEQASAGLHEHVGSCASCAAIAGLVAAFLEDHRALVNDAPVPSSSFVWWRLQLRARRETAELAMRPITAAQGLALAGAVGLLGALLAVFGPKAARLASWLSALADGAVSAGTASLPSATAQMFSPGVLALAMTGALLFVVVPVAIYFVLSDR